MNSLPDNPQKVQGPYSPTELLALFEQFQREQPHALELDREAFEVWLETLPQPGHVADEITISDVMSLLEES